MTIHHTIVKNAAAKGVILTLQEDDGLPETITAHHTERNLRVVYDASEAGEEGDAVNATMLNDIAKDVLNDTLEAIAYEAEHPTIRITHEDGDWIATGKDGEIARDPVLVDLFETLDEQPEQVDGEGPEADEDERTGTVVPDKYKKLYAEQGHPTHCGDWLAETLNRFCRVSDENGKEITDIDTLETIANANDVAPARYGKLGVETNGWQGRFRMTIRNMLAPRIASKGFIMIPDGVADSDQELTAPDEWRAAHMPKAKPTAKAAVAKPDAPSGKKGAKKQAAETGEAGLTTAKEALASAKAKRQPKVPA